jgi:hypothetical protein
MEGPTIWFGLLGPLEVRQDGVVIPIPAARHCVLLATLLSKANQVGGVGRQSARFGSNSPAQLCDAPAALARTCG